VIDLDEVLFDLQLGRPIPAETVAEMRGELCAWRAAHAGGEVIVTGMRDTQPALVIAAVEAYRSTVEQTMTYLGFPVRS